MFDPKHRRMRRRVEAYVDGQVGPVDAAEVEGHLRDCWGCSADAETLRLVKQSLRHLGDRIPTHLGAARLRRWAAQQRLR